jgi:hypothetical protein
VKELEMAKAFCNIPELSAFASPTTVDELASVVALLPEDMRLAATRDKSLVAINRKTQEIAILRPCADGSWDVECVAYGPTAASTN